MEFGVFALAQQRGYHETSRQVIDNAVAQTAPRKPPVSIRPGMPNIPSTIAACAAAADGGAPRRPHWRASPSRRPALARRDAG